jgi:hypothetical protein
VATDTWGVEVRPNETPDCFQPLHMISLRNTGLLLGEIFFLDALARACAEDGRYEFLFTAPAADPGAVGSPTGDQVAADVHRRKAASQTVLLERDRVATVT